MKKFGSLAFVLVLAALGIDRAAAQEAPAAPAPGAAQAPAPAGSAIAQPSCRSAPTQMPRAHSTASFGQMATLKPGACLRSRPQVNGGDVVPGSTGTQVTLVSNEVMQNVDGSWWYVGTAGRTAWALESDLDFGGAAPPQPQPQPAPAPEPQPQQEAPQQAPPQVGR